MGVSGLEITQNYIEHLVDAYGNSVLRLAYTYLKNISDAEDIVQDVFIKVMETKPDFRDKTHEKAWLLRTAANLCKNKLTLLRNKNKCSIDDFAEVLSDNSTEKDDSFVLNAVLSLPPKYKVPIYLYYYEGYSTAEISKITEKPEATVRSLLSRARNKLKPILKEEYDFE